MKKLKISAFIVLAGIFLVTGCENVFSPPEQAGSPQGNVIVRIGVGDAERARTLSPSEDLFTRYELTFSGSENHAPVAVNPGTASALSLIPGNWTITASAYTGEGGAALAAQGSWSGAVNAGDTVDVAIILAPAPGGGSGNLSYSVDLPAGLQSAALTLLDTDNANAGATPINLLEAGKNTGTINLNTGSYLLCIRLTNTDDKSAGRTEALHIYPNLTVNAAFAFSADDFYREELPNPSNLQATATSVNSISVSWDPVEGASGYSVKS